MLKHRKVPFAIAFILFVLVIGQSAFAASSTVNGNVNTDTPDAPQSYHFYRAVGLVAKNVFGASLWSNSRHMDWNIKADNSAITSSALSSSYSTFFLSPWTLKASASKRYYSNSVEHSWAAGDVASCAIDCKASISFGASGSGSGSSFSASVNFSVSALIGQYVCMTTIADVQKGTNPKVSYCYMRMSN